MRPLYTLLIIGSMLSRVCTLMFPKRGFSYWQALLSLPKLSWATFCIFYIALAIPIFSSAQNGSSNPQILFNAPLYEGLKWRNIGPFRGGRSVAGVGVKNNPLRYYMGSTGGGVWKTDDAGLNWENISDGSFTSGSVGAIAIAESDPNVIFVGMGEHPVRGVMTSSGDGLYKSCDAGKNWKYVGLPHSRHIAEIQIHPQNPDIVFVAVQGALYGPSKDRGVYKSIDGGITWQQVLFINETTGAADIKMDPNNPRILYAGMWDHQRFPWAIRSGGPGSGIYKSTDNGENWKRIGEGLPKELGKVGICVSPVNTDILYANIEAENGGVFRSNDAGETWEQTNAQRLTIARAWYYIEIVAHPTDPETVYVLNAHLLKSTDGGKTFKSIPNPHSDQHGLWINPANPDNMILANDGGATITFNSGNSWSPQDNQPTGQFYRVVADNRFPYHVYGGQQDNSTIAIASRTSGKGIDKQDWYPVAGDESAFIAFNPDDPSIIYGGGYQGYISVYDEKTQLVKDIMAYPNIGIGIQPKDMQYRFNWNAPIIFSSHQPEAIYHAANVVLKTTDQGLSWEAISPDLTRNESEKQGLGGFPYTNEAAGGENYNTISYLAYSPLKSGEIWAGTDDGLIHFTKDEGKNWKEITPPDLGEALINTIELSPYEDGKAYVVASKYKFNDLSPIIFITENYGKSWRKITTGIASEDFVRVVREDPVVPGLLYAGTEGGLYISFDDGEMWHKFQLNLPICPITDLTIKDNDLIASTSGRGFWILDDIGSIQQSKGHFGYNQIQLYKPKATYKLDASLSTKPVPGIGQNPLNGVLIDYFLPSSMDSSELVIEIRNAANEVIRRYSNQKDESFKKYEGGPSPHPQIPAKKGLNRFHWDLRKAPLPSVPGVFILGDYRGSLVAPGVYTIVLKHGETRKEKFCTLLPDPRLKAKPEQFAKQQEILSEIENGIREIHKSVNRMRDIRSQMSVLTKKLKKADCAQELIDMGESVVEKITTWEKNLIQPKQKTYQDVINYQNKLSSELLDLKKRVDTHQPHITEGAKKRLSDLLTDWRQHKNAMAKILEEDIIDFNRSYQAYDIPALIIPSTMDSY